MPCILPDDISREQTFSLNQSRTCMESLAYGSVLLALGTELRWRISEAGCDPDALCIHEVCGLNYFGP
jgi:hypothetical protein